MDGEFALISKLDDTLVPPAGMDEDRVGMSARCCRWATAQCANWPAARWSACCIGERATSS